MRPSDDNLRPYKPRINRQFSTAGRISDPEEAPMASDAQAFITQSVRRGKSLVRPERERIDPNHRQYHYRQAAGQAPADTIQPSRTGNLPRMVSKRGTTKSMGLRRGKSVLGREVKNANEEDFIYVQEERKKTFRDKLPGPWLTYCYLITCCIPPPILKCAGIPNGPAQTAWREKVGLVGVIILIMAFVGFLTFGFNQAACPPGELTIHGNAVSPGYLIIDGWAYLLDSWNGSPSLTGSADNSNETNPLLSASGMDVSFLFPRNSPACDNVFIPLQGSQTNYFPCQTFNPNNTVAPSVSQYTNRTSCYTDSAADNLLNTFETQGVPKKGGGYNKRAKVYYTYSDVNTTSHLMIYNG